MIYIGYTVAKLRTTEQYRVLMYTYREPKAGKISIWPEYVGTLSKTRLFNSYKEGSDFAERYFLHYKEYREWAYLGDITAEIRLKDLSERFTRAIPATQKRYKDYSNKSIQYYTISKKG